MTIRAFEELVKATLDIAMDGPTIMLLSADLRGFTPKGQSAVLVQYDSSSFDSPMSAGAQRRRYGISIYVGAKSLRAEGAHRGSLDLLDETRAVLTGLRFPEQGEGDCLLYPTGERFIYHDEATAFWWYQQRYTANGLWVAP